MKVKYTGDDWINFNKVFTVIEEYETSYIVQAKGHVARLPKNDCEILEE